MAPLFGRGDVGGLLLARALRRPQMAHVDGSIAGDIDHRARASGDQTRHVGRGLSHPSARTILRSVDRVAHRDVDFPGFAQQGALGAIFHPLLGNESDALASRLLRIFGSISGIVHASDARLKKALLDHVELAGSISVARSLYLAALDERIAREEVDPLSKDLHDFLKLEIGRQTTECLVVIFVDQHRGFIAYELVAKGSMLELSFPLKSLFSRAFELNAKGMVLAHNHPSGSSEPSVQDKIQSERIARSAGELGIELIDHLIVGDEITSMQSAGWL